MACCKMFMNGNGNNELPILPVPLDLQTSNRFSHVHKTLKRFSLKSLFIDDDSIAGPLEFTNGVFTLFQTTKLAVYRHVAFVCHHQRACLRAVVAILTRLLHRFLITMGRIFIAISWLQLCLSRSSPWHFTCASRKSSSTSWLRKWRKSLGDCCNWIVNRNRNASCCFIANDFRAGKFLIPFEKVNK